MAISPDHEMCQNCIPFSLEKSPSNDFGSDAVQWPKVKPKLLSLFPLKPAVESMTSYQSSVTTFSGEATQQRSERDSRTVVAIRGGDEFESRDLDHDNCVQMLSSKFLALECVPEETDLETELKRLRKQQLAEFSEAPCRSALIDSVCHQFSTPPSMDPYKILEAVKGQCIGGDGKFVDSKSRSTRQYNRASSILDRKLNRLRSAKCSSRAVALNGSPWSRTCGPSKRTTEGQLGANAVGNLRRTAARHGPRPRSSTFRGVTHYKRTGRWEAHIWKKGKQIYLGASSTAEKAARAYDRAALHFRKLGAELNFDLQDYEGELRRLMELSHSELVTMLRKQSAGEGRAFPEYPPITVKKPQANSELPNVTT